MKGLSLQISLMEHIKLARLLTVMHMISAVGGWRKTEVLILDISIHIFDMPGADED